MDVFICRAKSNSRLFATLLQLHYIADILNDYCYAVTCFTFHIAHLMFVLVRFCCLYGLMLFRDAFELVTVMQMYLLCKCFCDINIC